MESKEGIDIILIVALGSLGMITLGFFTIVFVVMYQKKILSHKVVLQETESRHQRQLLSTSIEVAEQERQKIANNIHDDVGIILSTVKLNYSKMKMNLNNKELAEELLQINAGLLDETIGTIRAISNDLKPTTLLKLGYLRGVQELCNQLNSSGLVKTTFTADEKVEILLDKKHELQLYRLVKEVCNNIIKHSRASSMDVVININNELINTSICHNGIGITTSEVDKLASASEGIGLRSILSRSQITSSTIRYLIISKEVAKIEINTPLHSIKEN